MKSHVIFLKIGESEKWCKGETKEFAGWACPGCCDETGSYLERMCSFSVSFIHSCAYSYKHLLCDTVMLGYCAGHCTAKNMAVFFQELATVLLPFSRLSIPISQTFLVRPHFRSLAGSCFCGQEVPWGLLFLGTLSALFSPVHSWSGVHLPGSTCHGILSCRVLPLFIVCWMVGWSHCAVGALGGCHICSVPWVRPVPVSC